MKKITPSTDYTKTLFILFFLLFSLLGIAQSQTFTSSGTFTVPAGVTSVTVEAWGGGGAGGGTANVAKVTGGGGGGGAYTKVTNVAVSTGSITVTIGTGGTAVSGASGGNGGLTTFASSVPVTANGGTGGNLGDGTTQNGIGGIGGIGTFNGGNGGTGNSSGTTSGTSGGGGGSAGASGAGGNATTIGGIAGAGSPSGYAGPDGKANSANGINATSTNYGAGGSGGAANSASTKTGGNGAGGQIIVTWVVPCPTYALTSTTTPSSKCIGTASTVTLANTTTTNLPVGTYTVTYNLSAPNAATASTATMVVTTAGTGTFTTSSLANAGATTITVTNLASGSCSNAISTNNTAIVTTTTVVPAQPSTITGTTTPCSGIVQTYSVVNVSGTTYTWAFPAGWVQNSGTTTNSITVTPSTTSGNITVTPSNSCGNGTVQTLGITVTVSPTITGTTPGSRSGTGTVILAATASAGTISWFTGLTGGTAIGTGSPFTTPSISTTTNYYVETANGSCISSPRTIVVATVGAAPEIDVQGNSTSIVSGDASPSTGDDTDFGSTNEGVSVVKTYTIKNTGTASLTITSITSSDATNYTISNIPTSVSAGSTKTFKVTFNPTIAGIIPSIITIVNNDSDENSYTFTIIGTGMAPAPEIDIQGNSTSIASGDSTPSTTDYTNFGSTAGGVGVTKTYTIKNTGTTALTIGTVTLGDTTNYFLATTPSSPVSAGSSTTFKVTFNPTISGVLPTTISIVNNDSDENPYYFSITGTSTGGTTDINIQGNTNNIVDGATGTSITNNTDFGSSNAGTSVTYTYTVYNTGTAALTLGAITLADLTNYKYSPPVTSSISPGGSTTFTITFTPTTTGALPTTFSMVTNATGSKNPYNFTITGTGVNATEINVLGNGTTIPDGNTTIATTNWTNFGTADYTSETITKTFTIQNIGSLPLTISSYTITGSSAFSIITAPSASVAAQGSTTIVIKFAPSALGTNNATVTINNNDSDEGVYDFAIQGIGIQTFYDSDGDGVNDNVDIDDDNDGIKDATEEANCNLANGTKSNYKFLNETFGAGGRTTINTTYAAETSYCYEDGNPSANKPGCANLNQYSLDDGEYTVGSTAQIATWSDGDGVNDIWYAGPDHTGDINGRMAMFNADTAAGIFYTATITGVFSNLPISYSFWVINLDVKTGRILPNIKVSFQTLAGVEITSINTGNIAPSDTTGSPSNWKQFTASLNLGVSAFKVVFINNSSGGAGNDLAIDDIGITQTLCDYDGDNVADMFDLDSDNDGIPDVVEAGLGQYSNGQGLMKVGTIGTDGLNTNAITAAGLPTLDSDLDGVPNDLDLDSDNDSVFDVDESGAGNINAATGYANGDGDITGDGKGDGLDTEAFRAKDANGDGTLEYMGDGILDLFDFSGVAVFSSEYGNLNQGNASGTGPSGIGQYVNYVLDSDSDGIPDYLDITSKGVGIYDISNNKLIYAPKTFDTNYDGIIDTSTDADKDGILDAFDTNTTTKGSPRNINTKLYLDFDGRNDYAQDTTVLTGSTGSLMAWIDLNSTFSGDGFIVGQNSFYLRATSGKTVEVYCNGKTLSTTVLDTKRWYHVAATYDGTKLNLYLNGTKVATTTTSGSIADASLLTIGRSPATLSTDFFKGKIDEIRIFNVGLSDNQVARMAYQEIDETSSNLKGSYITGKEIDQDLTTSTGALTFTNMLRYYRMDTYKDDIIDNLSTPTIDITGTKIYNHKNIYLQQAPMPFVTIADGDLATAITDITKDIQGTDVNNYSTIVNVKHINTTTVNRTDVGLIVDSGKSLTVNGDSGLTNTWWLSLNGTIDLNGRSQLIQNSTSDLDVSSAGYIEKDQQGVANKYNYNYWSPPVSSISNSVNNAGFSVNGVMKDGFNDIPRDINWIGGVDGIPGNATTAVSLARYWLFKFESDAALYANWIQITENSSLRTGQGYTLKGSGAVTNFTFVGKPNNGTITTNTVAPNQLLLIGNPYPSALDAYAFINDNINSINKATDGTLYFWEHATNNNTHVLAAYLGGYTALNLTGGIPAVASSDGLSSGLGIQSGRIPKQYIPVGQGFFINGQPSANGPIIFNNGQRAFVKEEDATSNPMFKTKAPVATTLLKTSQTAIQPNYKKIRLGYNNSEGSHRQVLLGFMNDKATSNIDYGYDAQIMDDYGSDMFLLNGTTQLVISGESYFDTNAIYPIGVKADTTGKVSFLLDDSENFDAQQPIFIHDNLTNTYNDISKGKFEIEIPAGSDNSRFSLRFTDKTLGVNENTIDENAIIISHIQKGNILEINNHSTDTTIEKASLYNMLGQSIGSWTTEQSEQQDIKLPLKTASSGVYIVKLKTSKGNLSKKIIIN